MIDSGAGPHHQLSGQVHCETLEIGERAVAECGLVSGPQDHPGRLARLHCFLPPRRTQAPTVARSQAWKAEFRYRGRKIIAAGFGELEKRLGHDGTDTMTADVPSAGVAAAVPIEPSHGVNRADFEPVPQDIPGYARPTASLPTVIPQHECLSHRRHAPRRPQFTSRISSCPQWATEPCG